MKLLEMVSWTAANLAVVIAPPTCSILNNYHDDDHDDADDCDMQGSRGSRNLRGELRQLLFLLLP